MSFVVFADGSANLPKSCLEGITMLPCTYYVDGVQKEYEGDVDSFDVHHYYDALRSGAKITTSLLNTHLFMEHFRPVLEAGQDAIYIAMSSGISGTYQAAVNAKQELEEEYPDRYIHIVDSHGCGFGSGLLAIRGAELSKLGTPVRQAGAMLDADVPHMCQYFTVDDLNYLKRGGRISGAAALVGSVLGIKPILRGDETGHIVSCGKVRGNKKAYAELADYFDKRALDKTARIGIAHADNREGTDYLLGLLRERGFTGECLELYYEPVTGAHVGPGTVALFFYGTEK